MHASISEHIGRGKHDVCQSSSSTDDLPRKSDCKITLKDVKQLVPLVNPLLLVLPNPPRICSVHNPLNRMPQHLLSVLRPQVKAALVHSERRPQQLHQQRRQIVSSVVEALVSSSSNLSQHKGLALLEPLHSNHNNKVVGCSGARLVVMPLNPRVSEPLVEVSHRPFTLHNP